ncbi:hypothetical protein [Pseudomonas oryzihabitans]|uniref:hypothetical protein n=1 Tax=Pseudomonas oryzihabitans TaxID=47885 RepID=UPI002895E72F|nr:hypothetical protein [Pseudomonas oryzihabitans]MDT3722378.1 hypothetical protein [Pseudomonas oryzihabitans]
MASVKPPVQREVSSLEDHEEFLYERIWPQLTDYAIAQGMPTAEVLVCTLYRMSMELSLWGVPVEMLMEVAIRGNRDAREVPHG